MIPWAYDDEVTYWQIYDDDRSIAVSRETPEHDVRELVAVLNELQDKLARAMKVIEGQIAGLPSAEQRDIRRYLAGDSNQDSSHD